MTKHFFLSASAFALLCSISGAAWADAQGLADALTRQAGKNGLELVIGSATDDGDDVVLTNIKIKPAQAKNNAEIAEIRLQDVEESGDRYRVGLIEAPEFDLEKEGKQLNFGGATFQGLVIPKDTATDPILTASVMMENMDMGTLSVSDGDIEIFRIAGASYAATPYVQGEKIDSAFEVRGIEADMTTLPNPKARATMQALGYERLTGNVVLQGSWNPEDGRMEISKYTFDVDDAASLDITMDLGGITPELIQQANDIAVKRESGEMNEQAMGFAMLGLMQQLFVNGARIQLVDDSLTNKLLDFMASQQGAKRDDIINMAKGMAPMFLARLQNPAFQQQIAAALGQYLDDPQTLTITSAPEMPVPAGQIMGAAMGAPNTIPDILSVTVIANE